MCSARSGGIDENMNLHNSLPSSAARLFQSESASTYPIVAFIVATFTHLTTSGEPLIHDDEGAIVFSTTLDRKYISQACFMPQITNVEVVIKYHEPDLRVYNGSVCCQVRLHDDVKNSCCTEVELNRADQNGVRVFFLLLPTSPHGCDERRERCSDSLAFVGSLLFLSRSAAAYSTAVQTWRSASALTRSWLLGACANLCSFSRGEGGAASATPTEATPPMSRYRCPGNCVRSPHVRATRMSSLQTSPARALPSVPRRAAHKLLLRPCRGCPSPVPLEAA